MSEYELFLEEPVSHRARAVRLAECAELGLFEPELESAPIPAPASSYAVIGWRLVYVGGSHASA